ncbi:MAG: PEP-utilizing enzyme [Patescibacteria group bacterium]
MSYKNYTFTAAAHDYHSPYLRNVIWTRSSNRYPELLGIPKITWGIASRNNHIAYIIDMDTWTKAHDALKQKVEADNKTVEHLIDMANEHGEKMNKWTEENVYQRDLTKLTGQELIDLLNTFGEMQAKEYTYGTALPVLDYLGFSFVEGNLNQILKAKVPEQDFTKYFSLFTEPAYPSFARDQETDLLKLMAKYYGKAGWIDDMKSKTLDEIKTLHPDFYADLEKHTVKHAWVYYVYMGPAFTEQNFLGFVKEYLHQNVNPTDKLNQMEARYQEIKKSKDEFMAKVELDDFQRAILNLAGKFVWAKPRRKDYQTKSYYHIEKLMREIAKRLSISLEQARSAPWDMLKESLVDGKPIDINILNDIRKFHIVLGNDDGSVSLLRGQEAEDYSAKQIIRESTDLDTQGLKEIKGVCACPGKVKGIVRIINVPEDMSKMEEGNILVSTATTPSIVPAMKQAAAIITDEGGLTCHASIISRELLIPCIVGMKIATKVLKDGDMVEVDAEKGLVTIK